MVNSDRPQSTRSPLRYPGGKFRAIKVLDTFLPKKVETVLSPFLGGGSYELHLTELGAKVDAFDAFKPLVNFWQYLLISPAHLATSANGMRPLGQPQFKQFQRELSNSPQATLRDAAKYLVVNRASYSGSTLSGGYSISSETDRLTDTLIQRVHNFNNQNLSVNQGTFEESLQSGYDLVFCDPPYLLEKHANKLYGVAGSMHSTFDHVSFFASMDAISSPWIITYNDSTELRSIWANYEITSVAWSYGMNASKKSSEIVIRNF